MLVCGTGSPSENATQKTPPIQINFESLVFTTIGTMFTILLSTVTYIVFLTRKIASIEKQLDFLLPFQHLLQEYGIASLRKQLEGNIEYKKENNKRRPK
jgi:hypothetical protein